MMKIFIISPYKKTGGPRSLHQLGNKLVSQGLDVYMYYGYRGNHTKTNQILYPDSHVKIADSIEDRKENVIITPESDTGWLLRLKKIKKVIWWLSLDYYLGNNNWYFAKHMTKSLGEPPVYVLLKYFKQVYLNVTEKRKNSYLITKEFPKLYHLYNSEYVHQFLIKNSVSPQKMQYLCGPIDIKKTDKSNVIGKKKNIIAYNPTKMNRSFFKKINKYIESNYSGYRLVPIKDMNHKQVIDVLQKAKVYMDIGYFPGPERMPREAVMQYCNIVTSNLGSAKNSIDVPIPQQFKFELVDENVPSICNQMINMCDDFSTYIDLFDKYRDLVEYQIDIFDTCITTFSKKMRNGDI